MASKLPKHADNPRYYQDDLGQWWYQPTGKTRKWPRIRSSIKQCAVCGEDFLWHARTSHNATKNRGTFCTVQCANRSPMKAQGAPRGEKHRNWKGGRNTARTDGYVHIRVPDHPSCQGNTRKYVPEHRLVMEAVLGRYLESFEEVHHKNAIRNDNRPENLELWVKRQPGGARAKDLISYAHWVLETYGPVEDKL